MVIDESVPEEKQMMNIVPRQFMDMGRASTVNITHHGKDELVSHSSLDMGKSNNDCSGSPPIVESMDHCKRSIHRSSTKRTSGGAEDSPERQEFPAGSPGWVPKKVPKLSSGDVDVDHQASEETMSMIKKARVSVRARSEASMVIN